MAMIYLRWERPFGKFSYKGKVSGNEIKFTEEFNEKSSISRQSVCKPSADHRSERPTIRRET